MLHVSQNVRGQPFGALSDGRRAQLFTLASDALRVDVTNYGARIVAMRPIGSGSDGRSIVLGFDDVAAYEADRAFHGACVGRYANRIAGARYAIDGRESALIANDGPNTLHGGPKGFFARLWDVTDASETTLDLYLRSADGDQGFAGAVDVTLHFALVGRRLTIDYAAVADAPTPMSLTHHPYFNLAGEGLILDHTIEADADAVTPADETGAPTGEIAPLDAAPAHDLRAARPVREILAGLAPRTLDANYVMRPGGGARLRDPATGRTLTVSSDHPAMQIYAGAHLGDGPDRPTGRPGRGPYAAFEGLCLEPQAFPNAPNTPGFPDAILRPGAVWRRRVAYTLSDDGA